MWCEASLIAPVDLILCRCGCGREVSPNGEIRTLATEKRSRANGVSRNSEFGGFLLTSPPHEPREAIARLRIPPGSRLKSRPRTSVGAERPTAPGGNNLTASHTPALDPFMPIPSSARLASSPQPPPPIKTSRTWLNGGSTKNALPHAEMLPPPRSRWLRSCPSLWKPRRS